MALRQVNLRTARLSKTSQVIRAKGATLSTSRKIKIGSKAPVRSKLRFASDKDLPKFTETDKLSVSPKPTKPTEITPC